MATALPRKPFREHVEEVRSRLFWTMGSLLLGVGIGYFIRNFLLTLLLKPLHQPVYYSSPIGGFDFVFKVCFAFGFLVSLPVLMYHTLRFIEPILPKKNYKTIFPFMFSSLFLLILGMAYAYILNLPIMLHFFNQFSTNQIHALISTDEYLSFILTDIVGFGIVFQMPLILLFTNNVAPLTTSWLLKQEKYVIVAGFLIGAILTPDPLNQTIMALPIILLYQLSIGLLFIINHKRKIKR